MRWTLNTCVWQGRLPIMCACVLVLKGSPINTTYTAVSRSCSLGGGKHLPVLQAVMLLLVSSCWGLGASPHSTLLPPTPLLLLLLLALQLFLCCCCCCCCPRYRLHGTGLAGSPDNHSRATNCTSLHKRTRPPKSWAHAPRLTYRNMCWRHPTGPMHLTFMPAPRCAPLTHQTRLLPG
jgi:hypothetical protein